MIELQARKYVVKHVCHSFSELISGLSLAITQSYMNRTLCMRFASRQLLLLCLDFYSKDADLVLGARLRGSHLGKPMPLYIHSAKLGNF